MREPRERAASAPRARGPGLARRLREAATSTLGIGIGQGAVRALGATLRFREVDVERMAALWAAGGPVIYAVWHGRLLMLPYFYGRRRRVHVLVSRSRDGDLVSRFIEGFGAEVVRGSSSRGATAALLGLARLLRKGREVVIALDGPRGPRYVAQTGAVLLAKLTAAPIVPVGFGVAPRTVVRSWDAFVIPHPFGRAVAVFGEPLAVPPGADREELEGRRHALEAALRHLTREADRLVGAPRVPDL